MNICFYFLLWTICVGLIGCSPSDINSKRQSTMKEVINSIIVNNLSKTFSIVDTVSCFKINSKEAFINTIDYLHEDLSKENPKINSGEFKIMKNQNSHLITYQILLPLTKSTFKSVKIIFEFEDENFDKVYYFNAYFNKAKPELLDPAPEPQS